MAAITLANCTVTVLNASGVKIVRIVTPATADDGDTIDCATLFNSGCIALCIGATDDVVLGTAASYTTTITLPGSTDNEARTIIAIGD